MVNTAVVCFLLIWLGVTQLCYTLSNNDKVPHVYHSRHSHSHKRIDIVDGAAKFYQDVNETGSRTDKVDGVHYYQGLYGTFLYQMRDLALRNDEIIKMLEIGLGCGSHYGEGESVRIWKKVFTSPNAAASNVTGDLLDLWMAEINRTCVENLQKIGKLDGVHALVGSQDSVADLQSWIAQANGGNWSIIVDDGSHATPHMLTTFSVLWPNLAPGGLYFMEDMQIQRWGWGESLVIADVVTNWVDQLLVRKGYYPEENDNLPKHVKNLRQRFPVPKGLKWIFCQVEACVLAKCRNGELGCL
mmetsp:Transcript_20189/g.20289  ORF Transcript_20189/g.20289 Transcript_20189/m.20289 type:complete len:300 (-) Transcript_20189:88-987(-)